MNKIANKIKDVIRNGITVKGMLNMFCIQGDKELARIELIDTIKTIKEGDRFREGMGIEMRFISPSELMAFRDSNTRPASESRKGCLIIDDVEGLFQEFPIGCADFLSTLMRTITCESTGWHLVLLLGDLDDGIWVPKLRYLIDREVVRSYKIQ